MNKTFLFTSEKFDGEIKFTYNNEGLLMQFEIKAELSEKQHIYLLKNIPRELAELHKLKNIKELKPDLSFEAFWKRYSNKVGNKKRAVRLWEKLTDGERQAIFEYIPKYDRYLAFRQRMEKLYPETFLNQRRWESVLPKE